MKKKLLAAILVAAMGASMAACGTDYYAEVYGTWASHEVFDDDDLAESLDYLGFEEEEIALAETGSLGITEIAVFNEDKTYSLGLSEETFRADCRAYLESYMETLYEHCAEFELYGGVTPDDFTDVSDFIEAYASSFWDMTGDEYIDVLVDEYTSWYTWDVETGKYTVEKGEIHFDADTALKTEYVTYEVSEGKMTMGYSENDVVYVKQ